MKSSEEDDERILTEIRRLEERLSMGRRKRERKNNTNENTENTHIEEENRTWRRPKRRKIEKSEDSDENQMIVDSSPQTLEPTMEVSPAPNRYTKKAHPAVLQKATATLKPPRKDHNPLRRPRQKPTQQMQSRDKDLRNFFTRANHLHDPEINIGIHARMG